MKIELTDQQEQAVKQGRPVEVVDPASARAFIVVARESTNGYAPSWKGARWRRPHLPKSPPLPKGNRCA